ncbi:LytR/AlgR family response regulator transcription factor [Clostridium sp.]
MNRKMEQELIGRTQYALEQYWQKNCEVVLSYCADRVMWIGAEQREYMVGIEAVREDFYSLMEVLQPCILVNSEFVIIQNTGNACTIGGRYLVETGEDAEYFIQGEQRCTFTWELIDGEPKIRHIHVSNPIGEMKIVEGQRFINEIGQMARKYMEEKIADLRSRPVAIEGVDGGTRFISTSDILYAEARARYCDLTLKTGEIFSAKMSLTGFEKIADPYFVRVHRSYIVNIRYLSRIQPCEVLMQNKVRIPIPEKRFVEIREQIMKQFQSGEEKNS